MRTRTKQTQRHQETPLEEFEEDLYLEDLSEDELEDLLFEEQPEKKQGAFNLPTVAGLSMIVVGIAYIFQKMGILAGFDLSAVMAMLPWLAGVLIILLGFGVLSWRPKKRRKKKTSKTKSKTRSAQKSVTDDGTKRRLRKTRDKKIAGVCGGIAEYFNLDPTLVRIAFVIGTIISQGTFIPAYLILAFVMAKPEGQPVKKSSKLSDEERITIIRDS